MACLPFLRRSSVQCITVVGLGIIILFWKKKEKGEGRNGSIITLPTENKGISLFALTSEWESFF